MPMPPPPTAPAAPAGPAARGLLLDIGGVVLRNARELVVGRAALDVPAVQEYVERTDFAGPGDELWQSMLRHEITERDFWAQRSGELGRVLGHEGWRTFDLIQWLYHDPRGDWLVDEMVDLMQQVKAAGIPLVALTNDLLDFHGQDWADDQDWLRDFDTVIDGSTTGVLKPDPGAYQLAIEALGLPAADVVYLDDMPVNVAGGLAVGLQAIEVLYADKSHAIDEARRRLGLADRPAH